MLTQPHPTAANRLLVDLLCAPVSMRPAEHRAFVLDLTQGRRVADAPGLTTLRALHVASGDAGDDTDDDDDCMPWDEPFYTVENGIALVPICGRIVKGYDPVTCWWYGLMSTDALQQALTEIAGRADIAAVVFTFNSPGGSSAGMPEAADAIAALSDSKLTVAFVGDQACSNGYRLAAACNLIFATRSACLGCIGTYIALYDYTEMMTKVGIKLQLFAQGKYKGLGLEGNPITDDQAAFLAETVQRSNDMFTAFVTTQRPAVKPESMEGQWFDGEQAVTLGLADAIVPSLDAVLAQIAASITPASATLA